MISGLAERGVLWHLPIHVNSCWTVKNEAAVRDLTTRISWRTGFPS